MKLTYPANVDKTGIRINVKRMNAEVVAAFEGKAVTVTIERKRKHRSSEQNRYYWGVVIPCIVYGLIEVGNALQQGNEEHAVMVHEYLKNKFLSNGQEVHTAEGEVLKMASTTTTLSTTEMMEYVDRCAQWAAEMLGVVIPAPGEQVEMF